MTGNRWSQSGRWLAVPLSVGVVWLTCAAGWTSGQAMMSGIVVLAAVLWVTEAVPLFVTSLIIVALEAICLANPAGWLIFESGESPMLSFRGVINAAVDPIIVLFFAGLVMARAAVNEKVDQTMAAWLLRPFVGGRSRMIYGVMAVTALFSMWMSNTATTAFMLTLLMPILAQIEPTDGYRKAMLLAVPFAANIGGMGTPIASPPNAIALGYLRQAGIHIGFVEWMVMAVPLLSVLIAVLGWLLLRIFRSENIIQGAFKLPYARLSPRGIRVVAIFSVTVLLWLTEALHGLPASVVALFPVLALLLTGVVGRDDINHLEWDILLLIGGGLALGYGISATGLDERIVTFLPGSEEVYWLVAILVGGTFVLSTLISNSAVANLLLPVGLAAGVGGGHLVVVIVAIAFTASMSMALPVSTPPNAMAYARGELTSIDMAKAGLPIGLLGVGLILLGAFWR